MNSRQQIRQSKRATRNSLTLAEHKTASLEIVNTIIASRRFQTCQHLALFLTNDGEPDLMPLIETIWASNKTCYLPVLGYGSKSKLSFQAYHANTELVLNRFGIPEPVNHRSNRCIKTFRLDLVLLPMVAFDHAGNRLGMGGGFYDKTFAYRKYRQYWHKPHLMGVAFESQRVAKLDTEKWDIPLDSICTEQHISKIL